jgi:hypothetical protein
MGCGASILREDWWRRPEAYKGGSKDGFMEKKWKGEGRLNRATWRRRGALGPDRRAAASGSAPKPAGTGGVWTREAVRGPLTHGPLLQCYILNPSTGLNHSIEFEFKF